MKIFLFLAVALLSGCVHTSDRLENSCLAGAVLTIDALKRQGMTLPDTADSSQIKADIFVGCMVTAAKE
jgi:hypothetical protein